MPNFNSLCHLADEDQSEMKRQLSPVLGESLEDLSLQHDREELEYRRILLQKPLLYPVPGRKFEGLLHRPGHHDHEELECQWSAQHSAAVKKSTI